MTGFFEDGGVIMRLRSILLAVGLLLSLASLAVAQTTVIPQYTVVPVVLDMGLSSSNAMVGQTFTSHCASANCGGFPAGTTFVGQVTSVTRAFRDIPGQISVRFTQAILPDGTPLSIDGTLTSLHANDVTTNPNTGFLAATSSGRSNRNKFIAYGAGAGLLIGALTHGNALIGALIGGAAGYLYGAATAGRAPGNVNVPAGTQFGIVMQQPVNFRYAAGAGPAYYGPYGQYNQYGMGGYNQYGTGGYVIPSGAGPSAIQIYYDGIQPFVTSSGTVMIPFRQTMQQANIPFSVSGHPATIKVYMPDGRQVTQIIGSNVANVNGQNVVLSAPSQMVNGALFEPADFISLVTGRDVNWNSSSGVVILQ